MARDDCTPRGLMARSAYMHSPNPNSNPNPNPNPNSNPNPDPSIPLTLTLTLTITLTPTLTLALASHTAEMQPRCSPNKSTTRKSELLEHGSLVGGLEDVDSLGCAVHGFGVRGKRGVASEQALLFVL